MEGMELGHPLWLRLTHFFNFLFLSLLVRSGIEIIGAHPRFYWNNHCSPGSEWLNLLNKKLPKNKLWTAEEEVRPLNSWIALPGKNNLGLGRHWHFWSSWGWLLTGLVYVVLLFTTPQWQRLIPTSWQIFPEAWEAFKAYLSFQLPKSGNPYNALQKLSYFLVVFALTPLQIVSGIMMAPALAAGFPAFTRLMGGKQGARSIHLIGLIVFIAFFVVHLAMIVVHGLGEPMAKIVLGSPHASHSMAIIIGLAGIGLVVLLHVLATKASLQNPLKVKRFLEWGNDSLRKLLFHHQESIQQHDKRTPSPRVNGKPPKNEVYHNHLRNNFQEYVVQIHGLVANPVRLSLAELKALPKETQSTLHHCIQGWSYYAQWGGVHLKSIMELCQPLPEAKYIVFHTLDEKWEHPEVEGFYYEVIDMELAHKPQTILAYEMNEEPLPVVHGAPLRLRLESQLGYKMVKYVWAIEFVEDFQHIGKGQGGWRDNVLNYHKKTAGI